MHGKPILLLGNPQLWQVSIDATPGTRETADTIADLGATLSEFRERPGFGRAIAAPQIGVQKRIVFMNAGEPMVLLNPMITAWSAEQMELWDDCFSFPDLMVRVRRYAEVTVAYLDDRGAERTMIARHQLAELVQHEIDHLDGILATDRAVDPKAFALRSEALRR